MSNIIFEVRVKSLKLFGAIQNIPISTCQFCGTRQVAWGNGVRAEIMDAPKGDWPELIALDNAPSFAVSNGIIEELRRAHLSFQTVPVICDSRNGERIYNIILPDRVFDMNFEASGVNAGTLCRMCGFRKIIKLPVTFGAWEMVPKIQTLDERARLFRTKNWSSDSVYCRFEFIEFVRTRKWKGWNFFPLRLKIPKGEPVPKEAGYGVDYLQSEWPPESLKWSH